MYNTVVSKETGAFNYVDSFSFKYALSFLSASCAEVATYPLDMIKTRLQIQGERATHDLSFKYRGMVQTGIGIVREEGFFRLWHGITPAIYRHLIYSGSRMTLYELIRESYLHKNADGTIDLWKAVLGGVVAGGFGQFLANPTDLVKVQIQMEGRRRLQGLPPRVTGTWDAFLKIYSSGGLRGLWKGWAPNVQRAALVNMGDLTTYDTSKHLILKHSNLNDNVVTHILASISSGLVAASLGTPADVIKTRIMNQPTDEKGRGLLYKSSVDCLLRTAREEGFGALYKGFIPIWTRMAPWSLTFWITYEELRKYTGVTAF